MIKINNLHKSYKKNKVLKGLDLTFDHKGILALLGPNGSGKTTLLKCILGLIIPDEGQILFQGKNIKSEFKYRTEIGYLPQIAQFPENLTGNELIDLMKNIKPRNNRAEELIKLFNLENELDKKMGNLSGGNKQKINIVIALMSDDPFLILDEPSTGLDPLSIRKLKALLTEEKNRGKMIVVTTHIMDLAEGLADKVLFMLDGKIRYNGGMMELLDQEEEDSLENAIANLLENKKKVNQNLKTNEIYSEI